MNRGIQNHQSGSGQQSNNNAAGTQNISFVNSFNTATSHRKSLVFVPAECGDDLEPVATAHKTLWDSVAGVGASHNAEQQYERGECLPGTREEVLRVIWKWILAKEGKGPPVFWLSGTAGVGKTAIAMTVAKGVEEEGRLVSSFFFFRSDPKRNNPSALVLTIAHGLVVTNPSCRVSINQRISDNPMILEARMEEQFRELVLKPYGQQALVLPQTLQKPSLRQKWSGLMRKFLRKLSLTGAPVPNLILIDGLDECGGEQTQQRILSMIQSTFLTSPDFPLRFLICSRPEAWLQEAFADDPLSKLTKSIPLTNEFKPAEDIMKYYRHQFQEIVRSPKYRQVQFPNPWPTEEVLETLVEKSCSQFVYAATVSRFIAHADNHPIDQLHLILESVPNERSGVSPYQELDALYNIILTANRNPDRVHSILAAIVVLSGVKVEYAKPTPTFIELLLGLPSGQVALSLRGMHSVLNIRGRNDAIIMHHTSFREYLIDQIRSGHFHIDIETQKHAIARQWLQNLTTSKVWTYSPSQLYFDGNRAFFEGWINLCISIPKPSRDLLNDLWNVDLASTYLATRQAKWVDAFEPLVPWVRKDEGAAENHSEVGENPHLKANSHPSCNNGQSEVEAQNCKMAEEEERLNLVERLVHKFENRPGCFHLVCPSGVPPQNDVVYWLVRRAAGGPYIIREVDSNPSDFDDVRLTDCDCDLSERSEPSNPGHLAYQEACRQLVKVYVFLSEELAQSGAEDSDTIDTLGWCFMNMVDSSLLKHCCLDQELLLLCRTFFGVAKDCSAMNVRSSHGKNGRKNMLGWIETFPDSFAEEGETLKAQVLALPWQPSPIALLKKAKP
ncbi:hypothetical protein PQX77_018332 [Marasmius sp. AFHP31]|nr:hypothetical protein PQX77_018332 [Marasmius sp. AFHP31]